MNYTEGTDNELITIFLCPCNNNKYLLAGKIDNNVSKDIKKEMLDLIVIGCNVKYISIKAFRKNNYNYCDRKH